MPDINLQIVARGTNVSAQRRENNVVVEIDNTATEAATSQAIAAKDAALTAAATAEQTLARVEQEAGEAVQEAIGQFSASQEQLQALADILVPSGATATFRDSSNLMLLGDML